MNDWHNICITDKSGKEFFKVVASPMSTYSEIKNLKRHIEQAKSNPEAYKFLDVASAVIMLDGSLYSDPAEGSIDADALLAELDALQAELGL
jgi:hypothetical protein